MEPLEQVLGILWVFGFVHIQLVVIAPKFSPG
uniref:Uncharacterized protein n=1 Tax=Trichinella nativa TaxID=6335 RepID=A0A0V1KHU4_9BILA